MFYDNLKAVCDEKGVKITPIVIECGGAKGSISNWKKGASPNSDIVAKLAVRLNVSADLLIFGKEAEINKLTLDEQELLDNYNSLNDEEKKEATKRVAELATKGAPENKLILSQNGISKTNGYEQELLLNFRKLSLEEQMRLIGRVEVMAEMSKIEENIG